MSVLFAGTTAIQLLLFIASLRLSNQQQAICDNVAKGLKIDDANARKVMHDYLNKIRQDVAAGTAANYQGKKLPAAKNMYKLEYDCDMELKLQTEVDKCTGEATLANDYAQNILRHTVAEVVALNSEKILPGVLQMWYDPVLYYGMTNSENKYMDDRLQTFANMIYANATKVACYFAKCNNNAELHVSCIFNVIGAYKNNILYKTGNRCAQNEDCTTYKDSTCDATGLCVYKGDPSSGDNTMCPKNIGGMVDQGRSKVLNAHNYRRGLLARGKIRNGKNLKNRNLPTAYYMPRMTYDCAVEAEAMKYAKTCAMKKSEEADRQGYGENVYIHNAPHAEAVSTFDDAVKSWWTQIFQDGINWGLKFTESLRDKKIDQKGFTQMAWAKSTKLGCAIQTCASSSFVVCRYSPAGNIVNELIYQQGHTCDGCLATCNKTDGLC